MNGVGRDFWKQQRQLSIENSLTQQNNNASSSSTTTTTTIESVETISLEDAKEIIAENMALNNNIYSNFLSQFKSDIFESLVTPLTYESHLQQLLAFSNILYIEKNWFYPGLQNYFEEPIKTIRQNMHNSFGLQPVYTKNFQ